MDTPLSSGEFGRFYDLPFIGMAVTSPDSKKWLHVNGTLCEILGYPREQLVEMTWAELTHPEDLAADVAAFEHVMRGESDGYKMDKRFIRKDGTVVHAEIDVLAERQPDGRIARFFATIADITPRVRTEEALRVSAELFANLARQVPGVIYQFRRYPDGRSCFPLATEGIREIYEVSPAEVRDDATKVFGRLHPEDLAAVAASIERSADRLETWHQEYRVVLPERGVRWLSGLARPQRLEDGSTLWHGFITDITAAHRAQEELLRTQAAIASSLNGIAIADLQGRLTYVNQAFLDLWGHGDTAEVLGRLATGFWESPARAEAVIRALEARGTDSGEMNAVRTDGVARTFQYSANLFAGADGVPAGMLASFLDVTDRKRAEAGLRLKDQTIATSMSAIAISDEVGTIVYVNPAFARMWGYTDASEIVGRSAVSLADPAMVTRLIDELMRHGAYQGEIQTHRRDGSRFDILVAANLVRDADGRVEHMMASILDVTESRRLQAQLLQSQKMQTVGRLAGGIAHDFNNLLTVMKGYLEMARQQVASLPALAEDLGEVDRAVDSAAGLTQQLLAFSRKQIIQPRVLDLNASVSRMHAMLSRVLGEDIALRRVTAPDLGLVRFDPTQAEQILVNLAVNARDAMPSGGHLTLETANVTLDEAYAKLHPDVSPGEYVMLAVSDTGSGMSAEVKSHLFEPFFTTKAPGRGTGLGLPMVFGAVTQNKGRIEVYSEVDQGTTFKIYLPRVNADETPRLSPSTGTLPHGTETIVVVEDEDAIRALAVRVLSGLGYEVLPFRTGAAALRAIAAIPETVDLVLTDVVMPEMRGSELAERLRALRPDIRILFASGYTEETIGQHAVLNDTADFLPKPYSTATLARRVRAALDRPAST